MQARLAVAAAVLLLSVCAQAQTDVAGALNKAGLKKAAALLDISGLTSVVSNPNARWTFLAPSDAAVDKYLKDMGLTVADLKQRPALARDLVKQHMILRSNLRAQELFDAGADVRAVATMAGRPNDLVFRRDTTKDGKVRVTITDHQGNRALVKGAPLFPDTNKTVHVIDHVLWSDRYYPTVAAVCRQRRFTLSDFCTAVAYAGLGPALEGKNLTLFVPNNAAVIKAGIDLTGPAAAIPKPAAVADVLKLHVVEGTRELGGGFKDGVAVPTLLPGASITPVFERKPADPKGGQARQFAEVQVKAPGSTATVIAPNVHVGKLVAHGINTVLLPKAAATPAPAAAPAAPAASGRKLLEWGWGLDGGGTTAEGDAAESAIENAADGNESVFDATQQSLVGAQDLSVPGAYNLVNEGALPW